MLSGVTKTLHQDFQVGVTPQFFERFLSLQKMPAAVQGSAISASLSMVTRPLIVRVGPSGHQTNYQTDAWIQSFWSAKMIIAGVETMLLIRKGQLDCPGGHNCAHSHRVI